jgi:hypothetical protein
MAFGYPKACLVKRRVCSLIAQSGPQRLMSRFRWVLGSEEKCLENNLYDAFQHQYGYLLIRLRLRRCAGFFARSKFLCRP